MIILKSNFTGKLKLKNTLHCNIKNKSLNNIFLNLNPFYSCTLQLNFLKSDIFELERLNLLKWKESYMCFSPEASFAGGIIISSIGIATIKKIHKPSQIIFASIPLFFGIQQIAEGILWLTLPLPNYEILQIISKYFFLTMADVIWPVMIPLSVLFMELDRKKRRILWILLFTGTLLSTYYLFCLLSFKVNPQIVGFHIQYNADFPKNMALIAFTIYLIVTITPLFISSIKRTHLLGVLMFLSCLFTAIFFTQYLTSVWCFFAALISGVILWILRDSKIQFNFDKLAQLKNQFRLNIK